MLLTEDLENRVNLTPYIVFVAVMSYSILHFQVGTTSISDPVLSSVCPFVLAQNWRESEEDQLI